MSNVDTSKAAYEAFGSGDMEKLRSFYADDAVWVTSDELPLGGTAEGVDAIFANFAEIPNQWSEFSVTPEEFIDGGDSVVVLGTQRATGDGGSMEARFVHVITYDSDGKLKRGEFYTDSAKALKALGG